MSSGARFGGAALALFVALNLIVKVVLIPLNRAEYTDGILQLTVFENRAGLYPPLYGALARVLSWSGLNLEWAGRAVSAVAGALAVAPVYWMARRLRGEGAAKFAALFFTVSPLVLRWSARVMTDALFLLWVTLTLHLAVEAWMACRGARRGDQAMKPLDGKSADGRLALAMAAAVLATLTRYQGVFLLLPLLLPSAVYIRTFRRVPWRTAGTSLLWGLLPLWTYFGGFAHGGQFAERQAGGVVAMALAYWNTAESFLLISPYYFGYPVLLLGVIGLFSLLRNRGEDHEALHENEREEDGRAIVPFLLIHGVWALAILGIQAVFLSFQYRYMMPVLPAVLVLAGVGAGWLEGAARSRGQRLAVSAVLLGSLAYLTVFSCAVLILQRETFGDQREAAEWVKANLPPEVPLYSNERYGNFWKLGSVKLSFWTGRPVKLLDAPEPGAWPFDPPKPTVLPAGAVVILSNAYGGNERLAEQYGELSQRYRLRPLTEEPFTAEIVPLHDDVMVDPLYNQNPMGWVLRYVPQRFQTRIFQVEGVKTGAGSGAPGGAA